MNLLATTTERRLLFASLYASAGTPKIDEIETIDIENINSFDLELKYKKNLLIFDVTTLIHKKYNSSDYYYLNLTSKNKERYQEVEQPLQGWVEPSLAILFTNRKV